MKRRKSFFFITGCLCLASIAASQVGQKKSLLAYVEAGTICTGDVLRVSGSADAGKIILVTPKGPLPPAPKETTAEVNRAFSVEIGPFEQSGNYTLTVTARSPRGSDKEEAVVFVAVSDPPPEMDDSFLTGWGRALENAADASDQALDEIESGLDAIPGNDPNIKKAKEDIATARNKIPEIRRGIHNFNRAERLFEQTLEREPNLDRGAMGEYQQSLAEAERSLRQQSEQLIALGRQASGGQTDACVGVAIASQALGAQKAVLEIMQSGIRDYLADLTPDAMIDAGESLPSWVSQVRDRFLKGAKSVFEGSAAEQVLNRGPVQPESKFPISRWALCRSLFGVAQGFVEGGPWEAAKTALEDAVDFALDAYTDAYCLSFVGKMSGHTHVEAFDNGRPMYGLDNDWEGTVRISGAKPEGTNPVAFRGILTGRAKNFVVANFLRSLYAGRPGNFQFLTGKPTATQRLGAVFAVMLEGTLSGGKMALKARKGGIDYDGRVIAKLAVVVIPTGSPVPMVQKYDTPYQPGWWQVTRALGEGGMTTLAITMDGEKRSVKKEWTRELSNAGAKGTFKIKVDICGGCEDD